ncbi:MAG: DNA topoisomerase-1 [Candidatus Midichloriaceae bacterium]|jgi:DNA topoisomerase-1
MKLLIVESPAKAKTLEGYLGKNFKVVSSYGHVRTLPSEKDAIDPNNDFKIKYKAIDRSKDKIKILAEHFKNAEEVFLATDPDREGEAISWHILELMKSKKLLNKPTSIKRIVFYEITKASVLNAVNNPRELDLNLIHAQQTRQALDYLVGFTLSPVLWRKLPGSKSAGRVQSVALKALCERENAIDKFIEKEYWSISGIFQASNNEPCKSILDTYLGKKLDKHAIISQEKAKEIIKNIKDLDYKLQSIKKKEIKKNPTAPFITSTLIQESSRKLSFSAKKTMQVAQKLYEGIVIDGELTGVITYMRTDSISISKEAISQIRDYISNNFGDKYLPSKPNVYKSKIKNAQEAHEAIRATNFNHTPEKLTNSLSIDQMKLYSLIWKRSMASQMTSARLESVSVEIASSDEKTKFKTTGSTLVFDGFYKVYIEGVDNEDTEKKNKIPKMTEGENLILEKIDPNQHFTQPPPRYTEASLVKKMEELGIGRPSTYPIILSILVDRSYARITQKRFFAEPRGRLVEAFLNKFFSNYIDYDFTANLENSLDEISNGKKNWKDILKDFWFPFKNTSDEVMKIQNTDVVIEIENLLSEYIFKGENGEALSKKCPKCKEGDLGLKTGKFGAFIGCSNYPECNFKNVLFADDISEAPKNDDLVIGLDKETKKEILLKKGPYGFYLQKEDGDKVKRVSLPSSMSPDNVELGAATDLLNLPKLLGKHTTIQEDIFVKIGKFGPYLECNKKFFSLKKIERIHLSLDEAITFIDEYKPKDIKKPRGK